MTAAPAAAQTAARAKPVADRHAPALTGPYIPPWVKLARADLGTHEGVGPKDNPKVLQYFVDASHPEIRHDEVAWCAAATGAWLKRSGVKPSGSLAARSYEAWGQPTPGGKLIFGCIGVKKRPGGWLGHVGIVVGANATQIFLLAGNQGDAVSISAHPRSAFTAFRWPANLPVPKDLPKLPTTVAGAQSGVSEA